MALHSAEWNRFVKMDGSDMLAGFGGCGFERFRALDRFRYALSDKGFVQLCSGFNGLGGVSGCKVSTCGFFVLELGVVFFWFPVLWVVSLRTRFIRSPALPNTILQPLLDHPDLPP